MVVFCGVLKIQSVSNLNCSGSKVKELLTVLRGVDSAEIQIKLRNSFVNYQMNKSNANFVADIWSFLVHQKGAMDSSFDLLIWPIRYIHLITDKVQFRYIL